MTKVYVVQDGRQFRVYTDARDLSRKRNYDTVTAPVRCQSDDEAREWFDGVSDRNAWTVEFRDKM